MGGKMYQGVYINLDRAVTRRRLFEANLEQAGLAGLYQRFPAIDGATISYGPENIPGHAALGCTLSHLSAVKKYPGPEHLHVLEDDALLHPEIPNLFKAFLANEHIGEWDILMTDIFIPPDLYLFKFLHDKYLQTQRDGSISFLDIGKWEFAGASSYFVNGASKQKFLQMMEHAFPAGAPYDLRIRELAQRGMLKVYTCFPFFSTLSDESSDSTIAGSFEPVLPLTEYRRSFYIRPNLEEINAKVAATRAKELDLHMQIYLNLVASLISPEHERF